MGQASSSDVVVKNPITTIIMHLDDGLCSINKVHKALTDVDTNPITGLCSNYNYIRGQILQAQQSLEQSEQTASTELKCLDENIEILTQDEGKLEREMNDTKHTLDNLRTEQTSNKNLLKQSEDALKLARRNVSLARDTLQRQENKKETAAGTVVVGLGVTLVPFLGWIAGPGMVTAGAVHFLKALDAIKVAEEEMRKFESQVGNYKSKVSEYESMISQTELNIRQKHDKVEKIREEIQKVKQQREAVADFQNKVRKAVHILSVLRGTSSVAEIQTRRFILQRPLMKVMEDLMKAAGEITGNQLLCTEDIPRLTDEKCKNQRLTAICTSHDSFRQGLQLNEIFRFTVLIVFIFTLFISLLNSYVAIIF